MATHKRNIDSDRTVEAPSSYPKKRWLHSGRFTPQQQDVLSAALADGAGYTYEEALKAMQTFLKAEVR